MVLDRNGLTNIYNSSICLSPLLQPAIVLRQVVRNVNVKALHPLAGALLIKTNTESLYFGTLLDSIKQMILDDCIPAMLKNRIIWLFAGKRNIKLLSFLLQFSFELWTIYIVSNRVLGVWILWLIDQSKLSEPSIC